MESPCGNRGSPSEALSRSGENGTAVRSRSAGTEPHGAQSQREKKRGLLPASRLLLDAEDTLPEVDERGLRRLGRFEFLDVLFRVRLHVFDEGFACFRQ